MFIQRTMEPFSVTEIIDIKKNNLDTFDTKLQIKQRKRDTPIFLFEGKRQCRLAGWYQKYDWICGSPELKALFCFPCLIFKFGLTLWSSSGVRDINNLTNSVNAHLKSETHLSACLSLALVGKVRIDEAIDRGAASERQRHNKRVDMNREAIKHHFKAALFLVSHGLALRGHDEGKESHNRGNYIDLLTLCSQFSGNALVTDMLTSSCEFSGTSPDIQNDLIECLYNKLLLRIKAMVSQSGCISIMADETTDIANKSQLAVSVRMVVEGKVSEHLIDIVDVSEGRSAETLATKIKGSLANCVGVEEEFLVIGQSYDGAANMAGKHNSVQRRLLDVWKSAHFSHCYAHKLALVMRQACESVRETSIFFGFIQNLCSFFKSSTKRSYLLDPSLPKASATRWLSRGKSVNTVHKHYAKIKEVLERISASSDFDSQTVAETRGLHSQLCQVDHVFFLKVFSNIFGASDLLTYHLQRTNIDPETVCSKLKDFRRHIDTLTSDDAFNELWDSAMSLEPHVPRQRRAAGQHLVDSGYTPTTQDEVTVKQKMKGILLDVIACLHEELQNRFGNFDQFQWMQIIHPSNFNKYAGDIIIRKRMIKLFVDTYPTLSINKEQLFHELTLLYNDSEVQTAIKDAKDVSDLYAIMYDLDMVKALPNVAQMVVISLTIAITSVSCERTFSVLRRLKDYTRASMSQQRTRHLMLLAVESKVLDYLSTQPSFIEDCIDMFASMKERRIDLVYKK